MRTLLFVCIVVQLLVAGDAASAPREKVAVLIFGGAPKDAPLGDNITEVVIAALARRGDLELVGTNELRRLSRDSDDTEARRCLDTQPCAARVAATLGVRRIVNGTVSLRGGRYVFSLSLLSAETGKAENTAFRLVDGSLDELIASVESAAQALFEPPVEPGRLHITTNLSQAQVVVDDVVLGNAPLLTNALALGHHQLRVEAPGRFPWRSEVELLPGKTLEIRLGDNKLPKRKVWPRTAAYGSAIGALVAAGAGGTLGILAGTEPSATRRADAQDQFEQRRRLGLTADVAWISAGVLVVVSGVLFYVYSDHIFDH